MKLILVLALTVATADTVVGEGSLIEGSLNISIILVKIKVLNPHIFGSRYRFRKCVILCISGQFRIINGCGIHQLKEGPLSGLEKHAVTSVSADEEKSVRCCSEEGDKCYSPKPCLKMISTYHEAYEVCLHYRDADDFDTELRLCTEEEAIALCCKQGCNIDREQYWLFSEGYERSGNTHYAAYEYINNRL